MSRWIALTLLCAACSAPPELLPPPFGREKTPRLFFPTGISSTSKGDLVVANGNFDHTYDAGTLVTIRHSFFQQMFAQGRGLGLDCSKPVTIPGDPNPQIAKFRSECDFQIPPAAFAGAALIGNYSGPLFVDERTPPAGGLGVAYTGSRDSNGLNRAVVKSDGSLGCTNDLSSTDCRPANIDLLKQATLEGPYAVVPGTSRVPGEAADRSLVFIGGIVPHIDQILNGTIYTSGTIAALDGSDASLAYSMLASNQFLAAGSGVGPMVFVPDRRQLVMSGCYERRLGSAAGDPPTAKCTGVTNSLRLLDVDAASVAAVRIFEFISGLPTLETVDLQLGGHTLAGDNILWAATRTADALVEVHLPADPSQPPRTFRAASLPLSPATILVIPRPPPFATDLIAVTSLRLGAVMIYDPGEDAVVAQVERLGDQPWKLELLKPQAGDPADAAWVAASVFGNCRIALLEVPFDQPWNARLRGRAGACP